MAEPKRFFDPHQPQTLQVATFLLYLDAVFLVLGGALGSLTGLVLAAACGGGAYGIANQRKWGYSLAVAAAVVQVALPVMLLTLSLGPIAGPFAYLTRNMITAMFSIALVALLLHPQSREHQRIWFS